MYVSVNRLRELGLPDYVCENAAAKRAQVGGGVGCIAAQCGAVPVVRCGVCSVSKVLPASGGAAAKCSAVQCSAVQCGVGCSGTERGAAQQREMVQ